MNDNVAKYVEFITEQKKASEGAQYRYDDRKAPRGAEVASGFGDVNAKAVHSHLVSTGVPDDHAKAIVQHLQHAEDNFLDDSTKRGYEVMSKHGSLTVHSSSNPDTGKSKFFVH